MGRFIRLLDFLSDHRDEIIWFVPGAALITATLFGWWASYTEQPPVVVTSTALNVLAATLAIYALVPILFNKWLPRPFKISMRTIVAWENNGIGYITVDVFIVNQTPKNGVVLDYALCLQSKDGQEHWFRKPELQGLGREISPQKHIEGSINFRVGSLNLVLGAGQQEIIFQVIDLISDRSACIYASHSYPKGFVVL